jgi:formamidopyrimidine-DNA glycosylase
MTLLASHPSSPLDVPTLRAYAPSMPELPDLTLYLEALQSRIVGHRLQRVRVVSPSLLRTADPPLTDAYEKTVRELRRIGKQLVFGLEDDLFLVVHLMIAGRFHWRTAGTKMPAKIGLAAFDFPHGTLLLTEAGTKKRTALHVVRGEAELRRFDAGGIDPLTAGLTSFQSALARENHTLKRALTDPRLFSGIGNAYSDEILHRARLSPIVLTSKLDEGEIAGLFEATRAVLLQWIERLRVETGQTFPEKVTAFRDGMAVHGRYRQPCFVCDSPIQRIVYSQNESNYCPTCQTGGKLLADRALSRLLKADWPKSLEEMTDLRNRQLSNSRQTTEPRTEHERTNKG